MNPLLKELLDRLEQALDPASQEAIRQRYRSSLDWEPVDRPPLVLAYPFPADAAYRPFPHREVFDDPEKLLYNELLCGFGMSIALHHRVEDDLPFTVRANYGTGIIASLFGAKIEQHNDDPPWVIGLHDEERFHAVLDCDPRDFSRGICPKVLQAYSFFRDVLSAYPTLEESIVLVLPDLQGPFDNAELLRGSDIFLDLLEEPEEMDRIMRHLAEAQVEFARRLSAFTTEPGEGYSHQHGVMLKGNILLRDDTAIMVSREMYEKQIAPHDNWVMEQLDGGAIHSCGKIDHISPAYLNLQNCRSLDLGQPLKNDLGNLYRKASELGKPLIRADVDEASLRSGEAAGQYPTGIVFRHEATSIDHASAIMQDYRMSAGKEALA